jgi:hypothetical protein
LRRDLFGSPILSIFGAPLPLVMATEIDIEQVLALEKRISETEETLQELTRAIENLPAPVFTSSAHEHVYNTCISLGLSRY